MCGRYPWPSAAIGTEDASRVKTVKPFGQYVMAATAVASIASWATVLIWSARCSLCDQFTGSAALQLARQHQAHVDRCPDHGIGAAAICEADNVAGGRLEDQHVVVGLD